MTEEKDLQKAAGLEIDTITGFHEGSERLTIHFTDHSKLTFYHEQDCCELVALWDLAGDPADVMKTPEHPGGVVYEITKTTNSSDPPPPSTANFYVDDSSFTWTFFRIITNKGTLVLRWLGSSNGCYSEDVSTVWEPL